MIKDKDMMIFRMTTLLLSTALLAAQSVPTAAVSPASQRSSEGVDATAVAQNQMAGELPDIIAARVKAELSDDLGVPVEQASIRRYSRETWSDGCLGLGGPAESCLAALTEGWQVEVVNEATGQSYFYRTDLSGDQIRLSDREQNLPPSVRDRVFQAAVSSGYATADELEIADAEPQVWDGCYGLAAPDQACTQIAIFGWRAVATDGDRYWIYHTDNAADELRLNEVASGSSAVVTLIPMVDPTALGDETSFQSTTVNESGQRETFLLEADGRLLFLRERGGEVIERAETTVSQSQIQAFLQQLERVNFSNFDGLRYGADGSQAPLTTLTNQTATVAYTEASFDQLPIPLQRVSQAWRDLRAGVESPASENPTPEDPISSFSDVSSDYWASEYIQKLAALEVISGFPDGTFRPEALVTRAEYAAMLYQAFPPSQASSAPPFTDVPASYWAADTIRAARASNFIAGYPDNVFRPQLPLTRVQAIAALASGLGYTTADTGVLNYYTDAQSIPTYAIAQVAGATESGIVVSYPDANQLNPTRRATRAEVAALVYQAMVQAGKAEPLESTPYVAQPAAASWQTEPSTVISSQNNSEISLSASGLRLLTVKPDMLQVWDAQTGERLSEIVTDGETRFESAAINGTGTQVVAIVRDIETQTLQLQLWNVEAGDEEWSQPLGTPAYASEGGSAPAGSPDSLVAFTVANDAILTQVALDFDANNAPIGSSLRLHNTATGRVVQTLEAASGVGISKYALGQNGALLAGVSPVPSGQTDEVIDIWQLNTGELLQLFIPNENSSFDVVDLAFNPAGNLVVFSQDEVGYDIRLDTWDVRSGDRLARIDSLPDIDRQDRIGRLSPDGDYYFARSDVAGTRLINLQRRTVTSFDIFADKVAFDDNGDRLAIATQQDIQLFENKRGES